FAHSHAIWNSSLSNCLAYFFLYSTGVHQALHSFPTRRSSDLPQPDLQLRIPEELGGRSRIVGGYVSGPPELIVEVSVSSRPYDLGPKNTRLNPRHVANYHAVGRVPEEVRWFALRGGRYRALAA